MSAYHIGPHALGQVARRLRTLPPPVIDRFSVNLGTAMHHAGIVEEHACAHFIAQCAHESSEFIFRRELWDGRGAQAGYWRRRDLQGPGPLYPGLGYVTRGAGYIQTTGRVNFKRAAHDLGVNYTHLLVVAGTEKYAALMAAAWWKDHFPRDMTGWTVLQVTHRVNGGENGLAQREIYTERAMKFAHHLVPRR